MATELADVNFRHNNGKLTTETKIMPAISVNGVDVDLQDLDHCAVRRLRLYLKLYFFSAFKWKGDTCSFHLVYCGIFLLQIIKVALITSQMFQFGRHRTDFNSIVNRGHTTLRNLLLEKWDSSWETLPYPPSRGEFASYEKDDLYERINVAVDRFYNIENYANGFFARKPDEPMLVTIKLFNLDGFHGYNSDSGDGVSITEHIFPINEGLMEALDSSSNQTVFTSDIKKQFESQNISLPITRLLLLQLNYTLHSVRIFEEDKEALCLHVHGWITYDDPDHNGQVIVDMETLTSKIPCSQLNFTVTDWSLQRVSTGLAVAVTFFCLASLIVTSLNIAFAIFVLVATKRFMRSNFKAYYKPMDKNETDLRWREYTIFFRFFDISSIIADILTLYGTVWLGFNVEKQKIVVGTLDTYTVWLGVGCLLAWYSLLRFLNVHNKFNLLFNTIRRAIFDVLAYMLCSGVLFLGFWVCGYVVLGPYHVKFSTPASASEALLSIVHGDEMFATLNMLEVKKTGDFLIWWFSRIYLWTYIAIFTIIVINLLVAIFMSAYDAIKAYYERKDEDRDTGPVERALRRFVENSPSNNFRASMYDLMSAGGSEVTDDELALRQIMGSLCRVSEAGGDIILVRPRTLKAFMEEEEDSRDFGCMCMTCSFLLLSRLTHE